MDREVKEELTSTFSKQVDEITRKLSKGIDTIKQGGNERALKGDQMTRYMNWKPKWISMSKPPEIPE